MNKSQFTGYFPLKWRKATIIPIPKVNISEDIGDLRPIALTPLPGKILERFVHAQLLAHLNRNNILTEFQNGFRKNHSTVDKLLLRKLFDMKICNRVIKWITSYLSDRTQCTRIGTNISNDMKVETGVPQGSILGPLFFLCYINDITNVCKNSQILMYADDTVLYKSISENE